MSEEPKTPEEVVNEIKAKAWNECITPRLEPLRAFLHQQEWQEGIAAFLKRQTELQIKQIARLGTNSIDDKFILGRISAFNEVLELPQVIENHITQVERKQTEAKNRNPKTGY